MIIDASDRFEQLKRGSKRGADEVIEQVGAQAFDALFEDMHGKIDPVSRQVFAANFGKLLKKFDVFYPRNFEAMCEDVASSYENFRTTFGSMKNPDSKSIPSGKIYWRNYCQLLIKRLKKDNINLSEEYVAHRLTVGTRYHPTAKSPNETDQVVRSYQTLAADFDTNFGLLDTYREISNYVVDRNVEEIRRKMEPKLEDGFTFLGIDVINSALSDYFHEDYLDQRKFSAERLIDLTREELNEVITELTTLVDYYEKYEQEVGEQNVGSHFFYARQEIRSYLDKVDHRFCHLEAPLLGSNFENHAHCLLGVYIYEGDSSNSSTAIEKFIKEFLQRNSTNSGILDPVFDDIDYADSYAEVVSYTYLVLFPSDDLKKILPFIVVEEAEWTQMVPLDEDVIASRGNRFINTNFPNGEGTENNNLLDILSDVDRIISRLKETAPNLQNHPALLEKRKSKERLQDIVNTLCDPFSTD